MTWEVPPTFAAPATLTLLVRARDDGGATADRAFAVEVRPSGTDQPPAVGLRANTTSIEQGRTLVFAIDASDDVGVASRYLDITADYLDEPLRLLPGGDGLVRYTVPANAAGETLSVVATAIDTSGNSSTTSALLVDVTAPDLQAPQIRTSGLPAGMKIDGGTLVRGAIYDPDGNLVSYRVTARPSGGGDEMVLLEADNGGSGTVPGLGNAGTDADLFTLNPALMADGPWTLSFYAEDASGKVVTATRSIEIASDVKIGNFGLSFSDLRADLGNLPLSVDRTYDSQKASQKGDFGYGWDLEIQRGELRVDLSNNGRADSFGNRDGYYFGTPLAITLPGGREVSYTTQLLPVPGALAGGVNGQLGLYRAVFMPSLGDGDMVLDLVTESGRRSSETADATDAAAPLPVLLGYAPNVIAADSALGSAQVYLEESTGYLYSDITRTERWNPTRTRGGLDFRVRNASGEEYIYDSDTGELRSMRDRLGNEMSFRDEGDTISTKDSSGKLLAELRIERDDEDRVESASYWALDPDTDQLALVDEVLYGYDAAGDLVAFTDQAGAVTEYGYDELYGPDGDPVDVDGQPGVDPVGRPHFLTRVTDVGRGVDTIKVTFDAEGRLDGLIDAGGNRAGFGYTLDGPSVGLPGGSTVEIVTDAFDAATEVVRDGRGNVIRQIQQVGQSGDGTYLVTVYTYDREDNQTSQSEQRELSAAERYAWQPAADDLVSQTVYGDPNNPDRPTRMTDAAGLTMEYEYDSRGQVKVVRTPTGETRNTYDSKGLLKKTVDASGSVTEYGYDGRDNLTTLTRLDADGRRIVVGKYQYDGRNLLTRTEDAAGNVTTFGYDLRGRQTHSLRTLTASNNSTKTIRNETAYDGEGRMTGAKQFVDGVLVWQTSTTYDAAGRVLASTDRFGHVTTIRYDARGNVVETRSPAKDENGNAVTIVTRTAYDANGRAVATTDPYVEGTTPAADLRVTHTLYDLAGRAVETRRLKGVEITRTQTAGADTPNNFGDDVWASTFAHDVGSETYGGTPLATALISRSTTAFDGQGRAASTTSATGLVTHTLYDATGRQVGTAYGVDLNQDGTVDATDTDGDGIPDSGPELMKTGTTYNSAGRVELTSNPLGRQIRSVYDGLGRLTATTMLGDTPANASDDVTIRTEYDDLGRRSAEIDALGRRTEYEYDDASRLVAMVLPPMDSANGDLRRLRTEYHYDENGRETHRVTNVYVDPDTGEIVYLEKPDVVGGDDAEVFRRDADLPPDQWPTDHGHVTTFTYDAEGREVARTLPNGLTETRSYVTTPGVLYGMLSVATDFEGNTATYAYDASAAGRGRLTSVTYRDVDDNLRRTVSHAYDAFGRLITLNDTGPEGLGTTTVVYDAEGRVTERHTPQGDLYHDYDDLGRLIATWTDDADRNESTTLTEHGYDTLGRLIKTTAVRRFDAATGELGHRTFYQADGAIDYELLVDADGTANGVLTKDFAYDSLGRVEGVTHFADLDGDATFDAGETLLERSLYSFFADGRRSGEVRTDANGDVITTSWSYDGLGRLAGESMSAPTLVADFTYSETYLHDLLGNRLKVVREQSGMVTTTASVHDSLDRLRSSTTDAGTPGDASDDSVTTYGYADAGRVRHKPAADGYHERWRDGHEDHGVRLRRDGADERGERD